ncbi:unnamed protein product [Orchesella dallaii]|uniref:Uncharacterized protein n=1 Tax=Orchesella dallaii TaxID=48710 RepID=A0ABP1QYQ6_9HEXA
MFSRRYLQPNSIAFIIVLAFCLSVFANEDANLLSNSIQNERDWSEKFPIGSPTDSTTNGGPNDTQVTATPALSPTSSSSATTSAEKSTVTITPTTPSPNVMPTMIITATKVTLGHRTGEEGSSTDSNDGSTETPVEEVTTDSPVASFPPEKIAVASNEVVPIIQQTGRQARFHRFHESASTAVEETATEPSFTGQNSHESSTEFYREMDTDGGDSYGDFPEDNELHENLPTPMALINPNGEGNNPPLEDDFAEAFKKVNSNGKRRRFRGGRRGRMKLKKTNETSSQDGQDTSSTARQDLQDAGSKPSASEDVYYGTPGETTTPPSTQRPKRYRSTTPNSFLMRASTTSSPTTSTEDGSSERPTAPVVKNGPKPMILQSYSQMNSDGVTPFPQIERPGSGGHTEKISTYFFSTPSPSSRLRLRQKIRESFPSSTTTEIPTETPPSFPTGSEVWRNSFQNFPENSFFPSPAADMKIPDFVPMDLGLETDDRQTDPIESALSRPDPPPLENKAYSLSHHGSSSDSRKPYESYRTLPSSTTPRSRRIKKPKPQPDSYSSHNYDTPSPPSPTHETEKTIGTEYYAQGSNTEQTATFATSNRPGAGSHYDRTKDKVIFFNENPYSTQHSTPNLVETPPPEILPGKSQTVGSHLSVSDAPSPYDTHLSPPVNHYNPDAHLSMYSPGKVFPADDVLPIETMFKNGPPDSSHIHSPNMVEHSPHGELSHNTHLMNHPGPQHGGGYPYPYHDSSHSPMSRPGEPVYGTVEEVPLHSQPYDHPSQRHIPPPPGPIPYPFSSELPRSPHTPAMSYPPSNSIPMSSHGDHSYPHPLPPPRPPPHHHHPSDSHSFAPSYEMQPPSEHPPGSQYPLTSNYLGENQGDHSQGSAPPIVSPPTLELEKDDLGNPATQDTSLSQSGSVDFPTNSLPDNTSPQSPETPNSNPYSVPQADPNFPPHSHTMATHPDYEPANPPLPHDHPFHKTFVPFPPQEIHGANPHGPPEHSQGHYHDSNAISNGPYHPGAVDHLSGSGNGGYDQSSSTMMHDKPSKPHGLEFTPIPDDVKDNDLFGYGNRPNGPHENSPHGSQEPSHGMSPPPLASSPIPVGHEHHLEQHEHLSPIEHHSLKPVKIIDHHHYPGEPNQYPIEHQQSSSDHHHHPSEHTPHPGEHYQHPSEHTQHPGEHYQHLNEHNQQLSEQYPHPNSENQSPAGSFSGPSGSDGQQSYGPPTGNDNSLSYPPTNGDPTKDLGYSGPVTEIHSGVYHLPNSEHGLNDHSHLQHETGLKHPGHEHSQGPYGGHEEVEHHGFGTDKPHDTHQHNGEGNSHGSHDPHNEHLPASQGKKEGKKPFSNTPYVLMFPQLIPEEKMRPSPPTMLSKEIPVVQASSMAEFSSGSGEKPPLSPGFQSVPVHPRHQMYQVLAKTHYEKMMEKYMESKKRPPSAIYTPYGVLIPVGTNVAEASASSTNNIFAKPRHPPKFRGEKSLLNALLGSSSSHGRFHPPNGYGFDGKANRLNKFMEYEPAIDVLAEKLAMKIVAAQQVLGDKGKMGSYSEHKPMVDKSLTVDGKSKDPSGKSPSKQSSSKNPTPGHSASWYGEQDQMTMESKMNPELKEYLKNVLKGHLTEMIDSVAPPPVEETRRPVALSSKLISSIFRKGRFSVPSKSMSMMPLSSASMLSPKKVIPPQGLHPNPHHGASMAMGGGYPYPPVQQGPVGLLGTIKRFFNFGPHDRHDISVGPNFAGRTLFTNGTYLPYLDGPSPRSSHYPQKMQMMMRGQHPPTMLHQQPQHLHQQLHQQPQQLHQQPQQLHQQLQPQPQQLQQQMQQSQHHMQYAFPPVPPKKASLYNNPPPTKPPKKKKKVTKRPVASVTKWQNSRQTSTKISSTQAASSTTTAKPSSYSRVSAPPRSSYSSNNSSSGSSSHYNKKMSHSNVSPSSNSVSGSAISSKSKGEAIDHSSKKSDSATLNKRTGSVESQQSEQQQSDKPTKLDMFQQLLGSTRSVLNFFKSEARNSGGPTVLKPRSASTSVIAETET